MKKKFLFIPVVLFISLFFVSCEKEYSIENGGVPGVITGGGTSGGTAKYSFNGGTASCTGATLSGTYTAGTAAIAANTVTLSVTVDTIGSYTVSTGIMDGIKFSGAGNFSTTGLQTITLTASGTPTNAGAFNFTAGTAGCTFSVTVAGVVTAVNCKDCLYFPSCVGSKYAFADTVNGTAYEMMSEYTASVDTAISGVIFQKITYTTTPAALASNDVLYYNCAGGVTTLKAYNSVTIIGGTTVMENTTTPIKADVAAGDSWTDVNNLPGGAGSFESRFTMVEKGLTRTIGANIFNDVVHIHLSTGTTVFGTYIESATTEYYYAKGVGLIEAETTNVLTGQIMLHQVIKSYFIP